VPKVLVIEDEANLAEGIRFNLELEGYDVEVIADGTQALERLSRPSNNADLVILDVMLPGVDGFEIAERMRKAGNFTPVLMLTAKSLLEDVVHGLEAGADDYLPKPFEPRELLARLKAVLRRGRAPSATKQMRFGRLEIDRDARSVRVDGRDRNLTGYQFALLVAFAENAGRVSRTLDGDVTIAVDDPREVGEQQLIHICSILPSGGDVKGGDAI